MCWIDVSVSTNIYPTEFEHSNYSNILLSSQIFHKSQNPTIDVAVRFTNVYILLSTKSGL